MRLVFLLLRLRRNGYRHGAHGAAAGRPPQRPQHDCRPRLLLPSGHADIPPIDVAWLDQPDPTMALGIIGLGEVGMTGVAAAIGNAVFHATGRRVRDLPLSLGKLL